MNKCLFLIAGLMLFLAPDAEAQSARIGQVKTVTGTAWIVRGAARDAATVGADVRETDVIETGPDGSVGLTLADNSSLSAGPSSRLVLDEFRYDSSSFKGNMLASVTKGTLAVTSGDIARSSPEAMKLRTPTAILGVRGTTFLVRVGAQP